MFWTDEMDRILREMAGTPGISCSQIAGALTYLGCEVSRNAVIGRATRLGIKTQQNRAERKIKHDPKPRVRTPDAPPPMLRIDSSEPHRLKALIELEPHECRWPIGGWPDTTPVLFCAKPRCEASPYCPGHHNLGTQP